MFKNLRPTPVTSKFFSIRLSTDPQLHMGPAGAPTPTGPSHCGLAIPCTLDWPTQALVMKNTVKYLEFIIRHFAQ